MWSGLAGLVRDGQGWSGLVRDGQGWGGWRSSGGSQPTPVQKNFAVDNVGR